MPDPITASAFISGSYVSPELSNFPGPFAPPAPVAPLGPFVAGDDVTLAFICPAGGGQLQLSLFASGATEAGPLTTPFVVSNGTAGNPIDFLLSSAFTGTLPANSYHYLLRQVTGSGDSTVTTTVARGVFELQEGSF